MVIFAAKKKTKHTKKPKTNTNDNHIENAVPGAVRHETTLWFGFYPDRNGELLRV